jgi:tRNA(fMet)-specific endonuclease VapC
LHEQVMGCHTYINQAQTAADLVRGYAMLATVLHTFTRAMVLPFDAAAAAVSATLVAQRVRLRRMDLRIAAIALARGLVVARAKMPFELPIHSICRVVVHSTCLQGL